MQAEAKIIPSNTMTTQPPSSQPKLVLVTGANGYIGASLVKSLLEQGYRVRGTLRDNDLANTSETEPLVNMTNALTNLELVPLELLGPQKAFDKACRDVEWVFHTASPVRMEIVKDEQAIIGPAINGTLSMLRAANTTPTVQKFVLTSSIAAIISGPPKTSFSEEDWADGKHGCAYVKSKPLAERAAWKFMEDNNPTFTLSVMNPSFVLGPVPTENVLSTAHFVEGPLRGEGTYNMFCPVVDIRDVVKAHIQAAKIPGAAGKRFLLVQSDGGLLFFPDVCKILKKEFGPMGYEISTRPAPTWIMWIMAWFHPVVAAIYPMMDTSYYLDNSQSREILGIEYKPAEQTIIDCGYSLIEHGIVEQKPGYKSRDDQTD